MNHMVHNGIDSHTEHELYHVSMVAPLTNGYKNLHAMMQLGVLQICCDPVDRGLRPHRMGESYCGLEVLLPIGLQSCWLLRQIYKSHDQDHVRQLQGRK